jgi:peptide/nickel transport system permease protein
VLQGSPTTIEEALVDTGVAPEATLSATPGRAVWRSITKNKISLGGLVVLVILVLVAILAPLIAPYNPNVQVGAPFAAPSGAHLLGLDDGGYDVLSLLMWGLRVSLLVGFASTVIAGLLGAAVGVVAGYFGGLLDTVLMRITDYFLVIPVLPLLIVVSDILNPSLFHIILIIGLLSWTLTAIVVRAHVRTVRERVFVKRAHALGASNTRIIFRHILPQAMPLIVANTVLTLAYAVFMETALSFLGLGDPAQPSLGTMIGHAFERSAVSQGAWWAVVPPGVLVAVVVLSASLVGRTIEDSFNPRLHVAHLSSRTFRLRPVPRPPGEPIGDA